MTYEHLSITQTQLVRELQSRLSKMGYLDPFLKVTGKRPPVAQNDQTFFDGIIGPDTSAAFSRFFRDNLGGADATFTPGVLTPSNIEMLLQSKLERFLKPVDLQGVPENAFLQNVVNYMVSHGHYIDMGTDGRNIVYVEGIDKDGRLNDDAPDKWNDRRLVFRVNQLGQPEILLNATATTEPGKFYTQTPLNKYGAARIAFGQYKAWNIGVHAGRHSALVQTKPLLVHRDKNRDFKRSKNDPLEVGRFGINQHTTSPFFEGESVGKYSAGCAVGKNYNLHMDFIQLCRTDGRFVNNEGYVFISAFIPGDVMLREANKKSG